MSLNNFSELNLPAPLQKALDAMQFSTPTPIQSEAIPKALLGHDLIGCAQTGTGKTAAFCIPAFIHLMKQPQSKILVLAPTRELALQIDMFWKKLTKFATNFSSVVLIGGAPMFPQVRGLSRRPRMIIATPGRLMDHLRRKTTQLGNAGFLVIDEADRMLDMGFAPQLKQIAAYLPIQRQTLLFSATWAKELDGLCKSYLKQPLRISVGTTSQAAPTIEQSIVSTTVAKKNETLLEEINQRQGSVLIFARTQHRTDRVAKYLHSYGLEVSHIHGGRSQGQRNSALNAFRTGKSRILVATDIAARGIDVPSIAHVINYDLPQAAEDYVHRIGRTGRAGSVGNAVSFVTPEDRGLWRGIARLLEKTGSRAPIGLPGNSKPQMPMHRRQKQPGHVQGVFKPAV